jgi:hypothetical protein
MRHVKQDVYLGVLLSTTAVPASTSDAAECSLALVMPPPCLVQMPQRPHHNITAHCSYRCVTGC